MEPPLEEDPASEEVWREEEELSQEEAHTERKAKRPTLESSSTNDDSDSQWKDDEELSEYQDNEALSEYQSDEEDDKDGTKENDTTRPRFSERMGEASYNRFLVGTAGLFLLWIIQLSSASVQVARCCMECCARTVLYQRFCAKRSRCRAIAFHRPGILGGLSLVVSYGTGYSVRVNLMLCF